jgi:Skp family chaperone for outer membrane proteins
MVPQSGDMSLVLPFLQEMRADLRADIAGLRTDVVNVEHRLADRQAEDRASAALALSKYAERNDKAVQELQENVETLIAFRNRLAGMAVFMPIAAAVGTVALTKWIGGA